MPSLPSASSRQRQDFNLTPPPFPQLKLHPNHVTQEVEKKNFNLVSFLHILCLFNFRTWLEVGREGRREEEEGGGGEEEKKVFQQLKQPFPARYQVSYSEEERGGGGGGRFHAPESFESLCLFQLPFSPLSFLPLSSTQVCFISVFFF